MARHAQPRELAELKGATAKDPQRYRGEVPKSDQPLGEAPSHMSGGGQACWFEISSYAIPDVLTVSDRISLELASELLAQFRVDPVEFPTTKISQLVGLLARFGMTPSDRQKLSIEKPKTDDGDFEVL